MEEIRLKKYVKTYFSPYHKYLSFLFFFFFSLKTKRYKYIYIYIYYEFHFGFGNYSRRKVL